MIRPGSSLSRQQKPATNNSTSVPATQLYLADLLAKRDFLGAIHFIEFHDRYDIPLKFNTLTISSRIEKDMWIGYCLFHRGDYKEALEVYELLATETNEDLQVLLNISLCHFAMMNTDLCSKSLQTILSAGRQVSPAQRELLNRLQYQLAHKNDDETGMLGIHQAFDLNFLENKMALASMQYLRGHYQEASDSYNLILHENPKHSALFMYMALTMYKLDSFDQALDFIDKYQKIHPDSITAINLKACCLYQLFDSASATLEVKSLLAKAPEALKQHDFLAHNSSVFRDGDGGMTTFAALSEAIFEAKYNLILFMAKNGEIIEAYEMIKFLPTMSFKDQLLKAVIFLMVGNKNHDKKLISQSQTLFNTVGQSPSECDTIPGRQASACAHYLAENFQEVVTYLTSIEPYAGDSDEFKFNLGVASLKIGDFAGALDHLKAVKNEDVKCELNFMQPYYRALVFSGHPDQAWELFAKISEPSHVAVLLPQIANDFYKAGHFIYALRAFDMLCHVDTADADFWAGKRGAACGVFQMVVAGKESPGKLKEVLDVMFESKQKQGEFIGNVIQKWMMTKSYYV
jgi:intraflagellar transport protein 56